jgi:hypothetical protein
MAVCSSWRKLLICAWVKNYPPLLKSLFTVICICVALALSHGMRGDSPQPPSKVACAKFRSQLLVECHALDKSPQLS